jgi:peptidoglycan/LPS O-acetylase OafA/YrhL
LAVAGLARDGLVTAAIFALAFLVSLGWRRWVRPCPDPHEGHRDRHLDGLRAFAAVAVMASHYGGDIAYAIAGRPATPLFHNLGTAGVQVFFALTGFLFTRKAVAARGQLAVRPFLLSRLRRIVPMYSIAVAVSVVLVCVVTWRDPVRWAALARQAATLYAFGFVLDGAPTIKGVPYVDVLGTIWSLPFEWLFYALVPLLAVLVTSWRALAVSGAALAIYYGLRATDGGDIFFPFFLPGILVGLLPPARPRAGRALTTMCAGLAVLLTVAAVWPVPQDFTPSRLLIMTALFACVVLGRPGPLTWPAIAFVGDISYSIYLMHFPMLYGAKALLRAAGPAEVATALLAVSAGVVAVSAATYRFIERPFLAARA